MPQTNEKAFETYVETILKERSGWKSGDVAEWDETRALFADEAHRNPCDLVNGVTHPKLDAP